MPITAALSRTPYDALGDEAAADLVDWMQTVDSNRAELRELNELMYARFDSRFNELRQADEAIHAKLDSRFNELRDVTAARFGELRHEFRADFSGLRMEMHDGLATAKIERAELRVALAGVDAKIDRRFSELVRWSFLFWCGTMAAVAAGVVAQRW